MAAARRLSRSHWCAPNLPTASEAGAPGFAEGIWIAMLAPAGVPRSVVEKMSQAISKAMQASDVRERLSQLGAHSLGTTPEEAAARITREVPKFGAAIKAANIKPD